MEKKTIVLKVERKRGRTYLSNDLGNRWIIPHVDSETAIGTLVFYTMKHAFEKCMCYSDSFEVTITMEVNQTE